MQYRFQAKIRNFKIFQDKQLALKKISRQVRDILRQGEKYFLDESRTLAL